MNYQFDALAACEKLRARHASFLLDIFRIQPSPLWDRLHQNWTSTGDDPERMFAPLLVQGAWPYEPGVPVTELQALNYERTPERPLHPETVKLLIQAGFTRPLYKHQVEAIRAAAEGKTIVLSAGTGSGKTEAFLIPLLDQLFWDHTQGRDNLDKPGIRAIIVYPLNALVNNQVDRVLKLLRGQSRITFAYYTSRLKDSFSTSKKLLDLYSKQHEPCQIIDRKTLRGLDGGNGRPVGPPHILITNFSMLEYMLIRPSDRTIFKPEHLFFGKQPRLKTLVLDEAHVYAGSQAAEIHMLLRRTADRFQTQLSAIQGFATSATLGDGSKEILQKFAATMFEKSTSNVAPIIGSAWLPPLPPPATLLPLKKDIPPIPESLQTLEFGVDGDPKALICNPEQCEELRDSFQAAGMLASTATKENAPARLISTVVRGIQQLISLRKWLFEEEKAGKLKTLDEIAGWLLGATVIGEAERTIADRLLRWCSLARENASEHPFLPIRMHAMLRTPAGVWVDPSPNEQSSENWLWGSVTSRPPDDLDMRKLELKVCSHCGAGYLQCFITEQAGEWADESAFSNRMLPQYRSCWFPVSIPKGTHNNLKSLPGEWGGHPVPLLYASDGRVPNRVDQCLHCHSNGVDLMPIKMAPRAAVGAVVDAIYPYLGAWAGHGKGHHPGGGRRVLTFTDQRQGAAALAAEVEYTHDIGVNRQLIWKTLTVAEENTGGDHPIPGEVLADAIFSECLLDERALASVVEQVGGAANTDLSKLSLFQEFGRLPARGMTLEKIGLVEVIYSRLPTIPTQLVGSLSQAEWEVFLSIFLDDARRRGVVKPLQIETPELKEMVRRKQYGKVLVFSHKSAVNNDDTDDEENDIETVALIPHAPDRSRLVRFACRFADAIGLSGIDGVALLRLAWDALVARSKERSPRKWLEHTPRFEDKFGDGLQINLQYLHFHSHLTPPFIDPQTREVAFRSLRGIPVDPDSTGQLRPLTEAEQKHWRERHAVSRVLDEPLMGLWSIEHTAQIGVESLEKDEQAFREGRRNLLSSSTTLEMGVDLGGLTFVLMTNAPPGPSNYWQRAGRAGRRADGSSLVLTLAPAKPHDQRVFHDLRAFLRRPIRPPEVRLDGASLVLRHLYAWLLTNFFDEVVTVGKAGNPMDAFGDVEGLITPADTRVRQDSVSALKVEPGETLVEIFARWIGSPKTSLLLGLRRLVVGTSLAPSSAPALLKLAATALKRAANSAQKDCDIFNEQEAAERAKGQAAQDESYLKALSYQKRALLKEPLISYLVHNSFLPRFGFPVDVVKLDTTWEIGSNHTSTEEDRGLRMERGLDLALSEYVPGSEVVADKHIHRVQGLVRNWLEKDPELAVRRVYIDCRRCGYLEVADADRPKCSICGHPTLSADDFHKQADVVAKQRKKAKKDAIEELDLENELTPLRHFLEPSSFAVAWGERPRRVLDRADPERLPSAKVTLGGAAPGDMDVVVPDAIALGVSEGATLLIRSEGKEDPFQGVGYGYAICQACGFSVPEENWGDKPPKGFASHRHLRKSNKCKSGASVWRHMILGTAASADAFRLRLIEKLQLPKDQEESLCWTLAIILQQVAAEILQVDGRSLEPVVATYGENGHYGLEAVLLDKSESGVLLGLKDEWRSLLSRIVAYLEHPDQAALVLFENQYYQKQLSPELLRQYLLDPVRKSLLQGKEDLGSQNLAMIERRHPRTIALNWLQDAGVVFLAGNSLAEDSFSAEGLLRAIHARQLDERGDTCLLLESLPDPTNDEALLLKDLQMLIKAGVKVRQGKLPEYPYALLRQYEGKHEAIGAVSADNKPWRGPSFGTSWLKDTRIRAEGASGNLFWQEYQQAWNNSRTVSAEELEIKPTETQCWISVPAGKTESIWSDLSKLLSEKAKLGPLDKLGLVTQLRYRDRYFATNAISFVRLEKLLTSLKPASGAKVEITSGKGKAPITAYYKAKDILNATDLPADLSSTEVDLMKNWLISKSPGWSLSLSLPYYIPHARRLDIEFAPGGIYKRIEILFEHGLQGLRPVVGKGPWTERPWQTEEEHIILRCVRK